MASVGEYDNIKPRRSEQRESGSSVISRTFDPERPKTPRKSAESRKIVRAPVEWLIVGAVLVVLSPFPLFFSVSATAHVGAFVLAVFATLATVLALIEDQRRMRAPAYSLNPNFRKIGSVLYAVSNASVVSIIFVVAVRAATQ